METKDLTNEYKTFLESLERINLNKFIKGFEELESYKQREEYLNKFICNDILEILQDEEYLKAFYVDNQAVFINNALFKKGFLQENKKDLFSKLVYCYNTNSREFNKKVKEEKLKQELLNKEFIFNDSLNLDELKKLDGLKVYCVMDLNKIGLLGSFNETEELQGTFKFSEYHKSLMLIPKRSITKGYLITNRFYYKVI
jgi:hypothetical protein